MSPKFQKILSMMQKTGDRCIIYDQTTEESFVVMGLDAYEAMLAAAPHRLTPSAGTIKMEPEKANNKKGKEPEAVGMDLDSFVDSGDDKILEDERFYLEPID